jgi:hypothetical protein
MKLNQCKHIYTVRGENRTENHLFLFYDNYNSVFITIFNILLKLCKCQYASFIERTFWVCFFYHFIIHTCVAVTPSAVQNYSMGSYSNLHTER